jgi:hypothetical protein
MEEIQPSLPIELPADTQSGILLTELSNASKSMYAWDWKEHPIRNGPTRPI